MSELKSTRWKITIEYDGTSFAGFQIQPDIQTVQGEIERAIKAFSGQDISITVAGRTDSGVHALAQIAHFDLMYQTADGKPRTINGHELCKAINAHLIDFPISIIHAEEVSEDFHARFGAKTKRYQYRILNRPYKAAIYYNRAWWFKRKLDVEKMREGTEYFLGEHDFTTFRDTECQAKNPVRSVEKFWIETTDMMNGQMIDFYVEAQSFLHHQVRNMVGTLTLIGEGKWQPEDIKTAFEAKDRTAGGPTAPPEGLYLVSIEYNK
ncbi:MAG: tRNA pseudouridine(38-40) synthase TruA [Pseudomonadota bacterium]